MIALWGVFHVVFFAEPRFHIPLLPLLVLLAALGIGRLRTLLAEDRKPKAPVSRGKDAVGQRERQAGRREKLFSGTGLPYRRGDLPVFRLEVLQKLPSAAEEIRDLLLQQLLVGEEGGREHESRFARSHLIG